MDKNIQKRMCLSACGLQVREAEGEESRIISGKAVVFNDETVIWDGRNYREREVILPSCITPDFLKEQDVKLNLLHEREDSLCRNNKGEGTLKMEIREDGLYFEAEMPKCDLGDRCLALVRNKTYTGCSFEFFPEEWEESWGKTVDGREDCLIKHTKFAKLTALTIAMDPAYQSTSVEAREASKHDEEIGQQRLNEKREQERKKANEQSVRELYLMDAEQHIESNL